AGERLELVFGEHSGGRRFSRSFAILAPRASTENRFAVALRPRRDLIDDRDLLLVDGAVAANRYVEQQVAILRHDVAEHLNDKLRRLVAILLIDPARVVPVADASI